MPTTESEDLRDFYMKKYADNLKDYAEDAKNSRVENHLSDDRSTTIPLDRESMRVLMECITLQGKKSRDYQNPNSTIVQADYYPHGVDTIFDIMHAKMLRIKSVLEAMKYDPTYAPNFESIEDSGKDLINYTSFFCSYIRGKMEGQDPERDIFNRKKS
jgi:hypothetical protein